MNKKIFLFLLIILCLPVLVFAEKKVLDIGDTMMKVVDVFLLVVSGIVVILWVLTGLLFLTSTGDPQKLEKAKLALYAAIGGTVIILLAEGALGMLGKALGVEVQ